VLHNTPQQASMVELSHDGLSDESQSPVRKHRTPSRSDLNPIYAFSKADIEDSKSCPACFSLSMDTSAAAKSCTPIPTNFAIVISLLERRPGTVPASTSPSSPWMLCLAKTSYTYRMNDLAKSWIRIFPLKFLP
jgi:hypothetical protein